MSRNRMKARQRKILDSVREVARILEERSASMPNVPDVIERKYVRAFQRGDHDDIEVPLNFVVERWPYNILGKHCVRFTIVTRKFVTIDGVEFSSNLSYDRTTYYHPKCVKKSVQQYKEELDNSYIIYNLETNGYTHAVILPSGYADFFKTDDVILGE